MNSVIVGKKAGWKVFAGVFMLSLSMLMYEILVSRIFSVTTWYHFAFLTISIAMFGMALGAIIVYLKPQVFSAERTEEHLSLSALGFAFLSPLAILVHIYSPYLFEGQSQAIILTAILVVCWPFLLLAFVAGGIGITLALTRYSLQVNDIYAADLIGAALGCLSFVYIMHFVDGITCLFLVAFLASIAATLFAWNSKNLLKFGSIISSILLLSFSCAQQYTTSRNKPFIAITWSKAQKREVPLVLLWNSFSRIRVYGDPDQPRNPEPYGIAPEVVQNFTTRTLYIDIDDGAGTSIVNYDKPGSADFLRHDIVNIVHHLRPDSKVCIIGVGGGRDVLSAHIFKQQSITGVEINDNIVHVFDTLFAKFNGDLAKQPEIKVVTDEGRSYVTRSKQQFDIILLSLIDTFAASTSGAYSLTENSLYTTEAWRIFIEHLSDRGVLSVTRWYSHGIPGEIYKTVALAAKALKEEGVSDPAQQIMVLKISPNDPSAAIPDGLGTILVSKKSFSEADKELVSKLAKEMGFEVVLLGGVSKDPNMQLLASGKDPSLLGDAVPYNLHAPTDDKPFFFQMIDLKHLFDQRAFARNLNVSNVLAGGLLLVTTLATLLLTVYCIRLPYLLSKDKSTIFAARWLLVYFLAIGSGFMFLEISQIERLSIFLGHPVYGISVVLFALLLSTGMGSWLSGKIQLSEFRSVMIILLALLAYGIISPFALTAAVSLPTELRIAVSTILLFPVGVTLGTAFPQGMKLAGEKFEVLTPWLWGLNGAASVSVSVMAVAVAMFLGISTSYWLAFASYAVAAISVYFYLQTNYASKE